MMKINEEMIICQICSDYFEEPVECLTCHNNFCKTCIEELKESCIKNNHKFNCPLCRIEPFIYQSNTQFKYILDLMEYECSKCKTRLKGIKNYKEHKKNCKQIFKCLICGTDFNENNFIEHLFNNDIHKNIIKYSFDKINQNKKWNEKFYGQMKQIQIGNESEINYKKFSEEEEKKIDNTIEKWKKDYEKKNSLKNNNQKEKETYEEIEGYLDSKIIYEFQNYLNIKSEENFDKIFTKYFYGKDRFENFQNTKEFQDVCVIDNKKNYIISFKDFIVPDKCIFLDKYNLYYCFRNNNLNCECCENHICQPGNCICKECMQTNLSFHGLKQYYLINKAGRACKYSYGYFYCHCRTEKRSKNENGNIFIAMEWCHYNSLPCLACQEVTKLMDKYIDHKLLIKLKNKKG